MKTRVFSVSDLHLLEFARPKSHKGDNGRVLVVGGSSLFHSASLWAAELLAHFMDLVFYYSPCALNQQLALNLKQNFRNGMVIVKKDLFHYLEEAEVILIGPGMMREGKEGQFTEEMTNKLLLQFPQKKIVIDAGAIQKLDIKNIKKSHLLTPHWQEYEHLFTNMPKFDDLIKQYPATYLIKKNGIDYIVSWEKPKELIKIALGNAGLTKGGTGDLLAALSASFYVKNPAWLAAASASLVLNMAANELYQKIGPFYTTTELLEQIPKTLWRLLSSKTQA